MFSRILSRRTDQIRNTLNEVAINKRFLSQSNGEGLGYDDIKWHLHTNDEIEWKYLHKHPKTVSIIGAPFAFGQPRLGVDQGPQMLRDANLIEDLIALEWSVDEIGDLDFVPPSPSDPKHIPKYGKAKHVFAVGNAMNLLSQTVAEKTNEGNFALVLGGDHTVGIGSVSGVLQTFPNAGVIWVDAHADINTPESSPSGNMHGMSLAFVLKNLIDYQKYPGFEWLIGKNQLEHSNLVYVGLRDVDEGERRLLKELKIKAFTMQHVDQYGIGKVMEMALDHLIGKSLRPIHLSYDIDAVDPQFAPSTGTAVRGGLTYREAVYINECAGDTGCLTSMDIVEVNPKLKSNQAVAGTVEIGVSLVTSALGRRIL